MLGVLKLFPAFPWILSGLLFLYGAHATTLHRSERRSAEALAKTVAALNEKSDALNAAMLKAQAAAERVPGLTADLAGTRAYLKQVEDERQAIYGQLLECRKAAAKAASQHQLDMLNWAAKASRPDAARIETQQPETSAAQATPKANK